MSFITGSSNFPADFDLFPTGTGVNATVAYVLDEIRDTNGVVIQSGNTITAVEVNSVYTIIDKVEHVLGVNPEGSYADVATRLTALSTSGPNVFLPVTGGSLSGPVTFQSGATVSLQGMIGNNLTAMLLGTTTFNGSGNVNLNTTGNISATAANITMTGVSVTIQGSNLVLQGSITNTLQAGSNQLKLSSSVTTTTNDIVPTGGSVNLGTSTQPFNSIYVNNIVSTGAASVNNYVAQSGSSMFGNLKMTGNAAIVLNTGSNITNIGSGINSLGDSNNPFSGVFTKTLAVTTITGLSPITFASDIRFASGATIGASGTGITIGSAANPITTIYATAVVGATGLDLTALVTKSGSSMFGNLTFSGNAGIVLNSGSNITTNTSGVGNIGASGTPLGNIYVKSINSRSQANFIFNESLTGTTDGVNKHFFFANTPSVGSAMIFVSGALILPTSQYVISGTSLFLTGSMYAPTSAPVAGLYLY